MKDNTSVLEAELDYAVRMVRAGCATAEQAAHVCGIRLTDLQERLAQEPQSEDAGRGYRSLLRR